VNDDDVEQKEAIVLAAVRRLAALEGFPVTDFALVGDTDLELDEVRDCLRHHLAEGEAELGPGEQDGSLEVTALPGTADLPELGAE
jgi:hypothetical protein